MWRTTDQGRNVWNFFVVCSQRTFVKLRTPREQVFYARPHDRYQSVESMSFLRLTRAERRARGETTCAASVHLELGCQNCRPTRLIGCFVPRLVPPRVGPSSLSSSLLLPFAASALGLLVWRGGGSESESDGRTFDGIALCVGLAGVRGRGNEAGLEARDVDLPRAAAAVVEREVSFPFPRCTTTGGGGLTSSSPLSVAESTVARPSAGALVPDTSPEPLVSFC